MGKLHHARANSRAVGSLASEAEMGSGESFVGRIWTGSAAAEGKDAAEDIRMQ